MVWPDVNMSLKKWGMQEYKKYSSSNCRNSIFVILLCFSFLQQKWLQETKTLNKSKKHIGLNYAVGVLKWIHFVWVASDPKKSERKMRRDNSKSILLLVQNTPLRTLILFSKMWWKTFCRARAYFWSLWSFPSRGYFRCQLELPWQDNKWNSCWIANETE